MGRTPCKVISKGHKRIDDLEDVNIKGVTIDDQLHEAKQRP